LSPVLPHNPSVGKQRKWHSTWSFLGGVGGLGSHFFLINHRSANLV